MENWKPNPNAAPYVPRKFRGVSGGHKSANGAMFPKRKCVSKVFQGGLVLVLLVTMAINITFILETSKKLQHGQDVKDEISRNVQGYSAKRHVVEMSEPKSLMVEVESSKTSILVSVDGTTVLQDDEFNRNRGIHVVVLNQVTGSIMSKRVFDTYSSNEDTELVKYLMKVMKGRIVILAIKDEGTFSLRSPARQYLKECGSEEVENLNYRDMWAFVFFQGGKKIAESHSKSPNLASWADKTSLRSEIPLSPDKRENCDWPNDEVSKRRKIFCSKVEGYGDLCKCKNPGPITFSPKTLENNNIANVPIAIIASDRPSYLFRMLKTLLSTPGANPDMITVFIDGYFEEPLMVTKLFGLRGIQHTPLGVKNARICQHYKASLTATFNLYPDAKYAIVLEEDLDVSPDFFNYFSQTVHLLEEDESLYCISAWNDQGYQHSSKDPTLLYRVETMPGLGWLLKRKLYKEELEPRWPTPELQWDWDMWMRTNQIRKDRECIIPDISRTYHFGSKGLNMNPYFQELYFKNKSVVTQSNVKLKDVNSLYKDRYEDLIINLIKSAVVLDHNQDPCAKGFIPESQDHHHLIYIKRNATHDHATWNYLAKCYRLWDLDVRGFHKSMWRLFINETPIIIVGVPLSPYSHYKPEEVVPFSFEDPKNKKN